MRNKSSRDRGSVMVEYSVILAVLVAVFMVVGAVLTFAVSHRADLSMNSVNSTVPCGGELSGVACL